MIEVVFVITATVITTNTASEALSVFLTAASRWYLYLHEFPEL